MVARKIFIGSSNEALESARALARLIDEHPDALPVLWDRGSDVSGDVPFPLGKTLLDQIDNLPNDIDGAVLLATPDLQCHRNGNSFLAPVSNVVFEYGYLLACLGRERVFVLLLGELTLPSDVSGVKSLTETRTAYERGKAFLFSDNAKSQIRQWIDGLPRRARGLPAVSRVHGYSGVWDVHNFTRWRDWPLDPGDDSVYFTGKTFLMFQSDGKAGSGVQVGKLHVKVGGYEVEREVVNEVISATIDRDSNVVLRLKLIRSRIVAGTEHVAEGTDRRLREDLGHVPFVVTLVPGDEAATLRGPHNFERRADHDVQFAGEKFVHVGRFGAPDLEP
jgi:hypothetical protein